MKKTWHWVTLILVLVGAVSVWHMYKAHGGIAGVKSGLSLTTR